MHLIENLMSNFETAVAAGPTVQAPQNLSELRTQLRDACQSRSAYPDLAFYCDWYSGYLTRVHAQENSHMSKTRGQARRMWAEQSLIYQDMIHVLKELSQILPRRKWDAIIEATDSFYELLDEFNEALHQMEDWTRSEEPRCLKCGWNGSTGHCPHCHVHALLPVRNFATHINHYVELGPKQSRVFEVLMAVLEGTRDVGALKNPLQALEDHYRASAEKLMALGDNAMLDKVLVQVEAGLAGIEEMKRVYVRYDAQHLEDGWAMLFAAERGMEQATPSSTRAVAAAYEILTEDRITLTNE